MVNHENDQLNRVFGALGDPTRRAILARLSRERELSVSSLAKPFSMTLPAVMKHLDVLSEVGLVRRNKKGRTVTVELSAKPLKSAIDWLSHYERFWSDSLDRLAAYAESKAHTVDGEER